MPTPPAGDQENSFAPQINSDNVVNSAPRRFFYDWQRYDHNDIPILVSQIIRIFPPDQRHLDLPQ